MSEQEKIWERYISLGQQIKDLGGIVQNVLPKDMIFPEAGINRFLIKSREICDEFNKLANDTYYFIKKENENKGEI